MLWLVLFWLGLLLTGHYVSAAGLLVLFFCLRKFMTQPRIANAEPCCARCGHTLHAALSYECPGCGVDIREGGMSDVATSARHGGRQYLIVGLLFGFVSLALLTVKGVLEWT
ncbi:hypothetical protein OT109_14735 [Phycisphaeraceae bacterium D3-23]